VNVHHWILLILLCGCQGRSFTVVAGGDLQLDSAENVENGPIPAGLLDADLRLCNLEGALSTQAGAAKIDRFVASPARVAALCGRLDAVSLANNHALDAGAEGRDETAHVLAGAGIGAAWAGHPVELARAGRRVQLVARAFAPSADLDAETAVVDEVKQAARRGPTLVSLEWGHTGSLLPTDGQRRLAARLVDAGAIAVLGHGPHTLQGVERRGRAIIAYSLGNLAFACNCTDVSDAYLVRFTVDGARVRDVRVRPIAAGLRRPAARSRDPGLYELVENLSRDLGSSVRRVGDELLID
jgi:poly-gamma-glutamate synthesis protein (capsule biosynthesis protein)